MQQGIATEPSKRRPVGEARAAILAAADRLFYRDGVRGVGVDTVAEAAGVTKRTLYYHFASKETLIAAYLRERDARTQATLFAGATKAGVLPGDHILGVFDFLANWFAGGDYYGCPFNNAVSEQGNVADAALAPTREHKSAIAAWFLGEARQGGAARPESLGAQLLLLVDGALTGALVEQSATPATLAREAAQVLLRAAGVAFTEAESSTASESRRTGRATPE